MIMEEFTELVRNFNFTGYIVTDAYEFLKTHHLAETAEHSKRVSLESKRLAQRYHSSEKKAEIAGILHDISAVFPAHRRLYIAKQLGIDILEEEKAFPMIIHQKISKVMARELFQVHDPAILNAIECHTTLKKDPSLLELIVFVADKIEWDQTGTPPYIEVLKKSLTVSLEQGAFSYIDYLWKQKDRLKVIHPWLAESYMDLKQKTALEIQ